MKKNIGSSFDSWLRAEGIYREVSANAARRFIARQQEERLSASRADIAEKIEKGYASAQRGDLIDEQ